MRPILTIAVLALASCGPFVPNTDKSGPRSLASEGGSTSDFGVKTSDHAPAKGGAELSGLSCKNLVWDADPTNASAVSILKREAHDAGFNSVFITSVGPDGGAPIKNCWSAIVAKGIAFNS